MSLIKTERVLSNKLDELKERGSLKGEETVITGVKEQVLLLSSIRVGKVSNS